MKYLAITLSLILPFFVLGQNLIEDETRFEQLLSKSKEHPDRAFFYLNKAKAAIQSDLQQLKLNNQFASYYAEKRQFDSASIFLNRNIDKYPERNMVPASYILEMTLSYLKQDFIHKMRGEFNLGKEVLAEALELIKRRSDTSRQYIKVLVNTGENYRMLRDNFEAEKWLRKSLKYAEDQHYAEGIVGANYGLGNIYELINVKEAEKFYLACVAAVRDYDMPEDNGIYMNLGLVYKQQLNYSKALDYFRLSLDLLRDMDDTRSLMYMGNTCNNTANVMLELEQYDSACYYYQLAIQKFNRSIGENHPFQVYPRRGLIAAYPRSDHELDIRPVIKDVLTLSHQHPDQLALTYTYLGDYYLERHSFDTALSYYDSTMITSTAQVNNQVKNFNHDQVISAIAGILKVYRKRGNYKVDRLDIQYEKLLAVLQEVQQDFNIQFYIEMASEALDELFKLYLQEYEQGRDQKVLDKLWTISQINKGIKLKNQLRDKLSMEIDLSEDIFQKERQLQDSIDMLLSRSGVGGYDELLLDLEHKNDQLLKKIESQYPRYYDLKYRNQILNIAQNQALLGNREILLNFFQGREDIHLIRLSKHKSALSTISRDSLDHWIAIMNEGIYEGDERVVKEVSENIRRTCLLEGLEKEKINRIQIVPDGIVWKLNFAALQGVSGGYLGNETRLSYHYYSQNEKWVKPSEARNNEVLAFSYNDQSSANETGTYTLLRNLNESLPGTSKEIMSIARFWDGSYYYGAAASEHVFKESQGSYSIMHLAVHGVEDEQNPENSFLKFAQNDSLNDGRLYAYELYDMDNQVDLAVLTACNSGTGKLVTGEGMMSLGHAFMYAGANSVLASRWEVPDISAPHLMKYFYQGLKEGMNKSEALTFAQNQFLKHEADNITAAPFYWSGFYVVGDDDPIGDRQGFMWLILLAIASLFMVLMFWRRKVIQMS